MLISVRKISSPLNPICSVMAIRHKKDSSLVKALNMVKNKEADAFVSAGSSGAILVGGQVIVGRLPGVERPPIGAIVPTDKGCVLIVDSGANVNIITRFKKWKCLLNKLVAFLLFKTNINYRYSWLLNPKTVLHIYRTHLSPLHKKSWSGINISPTVNYQHTAFISRNNRTYWWDGYS